MAGNPGLSPDTVLDVRNLQVHFRVRSGVIRAVQDVSFTIRRGQTVGIIGESGSGKSVTARAIMRLLARNGDIFGGEIRFADPQSAAGSASSSVDIAQIAPESDAMRQIRGGKIGMIFQEPMSSLSPVYTVGEQIGEAVRTHLAAHAGGRRLSKGETRAIAVTMLDKVGIPDAKRRVDSYPHQLSGGQRQRVMIAIALSCNPSLLIADEPTTALDVTTQAQINDLMRELQREFGMAILYITHDLGIIAEMADEVAVMYMGRIVEQGDVDTIYYAPKHPYTRALLQSIPRFGVKRRSQLEVIRGMAPNPFAIPSGCSFSDRCGDAIAGLCNRVMPEMVSFTSTHRAACHLHTQGDKATAGADSKGAQT